MSKIVEGVPASITREDYVNLIRGAGFDTAAVWSLEFRADGIYATVKERPDGHDILDKGRHEVVKNQVYIPVVG